MSIAKSNIRRFALLPVFLLLYTISLSQLLTVGKYNGQYATQTSPVSFAMPAAGTGSSKDTFFILNNHSSSLTINGNLSVTGPNAGAFKILRQPAMSIAGNSTTYFVVGYEPAGAAVSTATIQISSNSTAGSQFSLNISGAGKLLYGPKWPPVDGVPPYISGNNVEAGRTGGRTTTYSQIALADKTTTYWGPSVDESGVLQLKLSLDGSTYTPSEVFTFSPSESDLPNGKVVWRAMTKIQNAISNSIVNVFTKATLTTFNADNTVRPLINPAILGLSEQVGGLVKIDAGLMVFKSNFLIEASVSGPSSGMTPYLIFYDAYPTPPGPLPGAGIGAAYSTIGTGTYWINTAPRLTGNSILNMDEGTSKTITTAYLNAGDYEDLPSFPDSLVFTFKTNTANSSPLTFQRGVLKRNNTTLNKTDSFTLKDIRDGIISYQHDGSETVYDEFQFSIKDSKKIIAIDGTASIFSFRINIIPVNDPPVTRDTAFDVSYLLPYANKVTGKDNDNTTITFSVVAAPATGTLSMQPDGRFTYTPAPGASPGSTVTFTYKAYDGTDYSNISTVTLSLKNLPPATQPLTLRTLEDITVASALTATDPEGSTVSFTQASNPSKGTVVFNANGTFTYQPLLSAFGRDYFTYKATDALNNSSPVDTVWIHVIPRLDEGDVLIADKSAVHLYDPATGQDTVVTKGNYAAQLQNIYYKKGTSLFALDQNAGLLKINPFTGVQTILAAAGNFNTNPGALGITLHPTGGYLVIADGPNGIKRVDTTSGVVQSLFSGGNLQFPTGVLYKDNGDLLVSDGGIFAGGSSKIISIQPGGAQSVVSTGNLIILPVDLALLNQDTVIVTDGGSMAGQADRIYRIALANGTQTLITTGGSLKFPSGIDYDARQKKLYAVNQNNAKLLDVNLITGSQTILSGTPGFLTAPFGLLVIASPVYITSVAVPADNTYSTGQVLPFTVNFSQPVIVNTAGGSPTLRFQVGAATVQATYISGSGTAALQFSYTIVAGLSDTDGIQVNALQLNGSTIKNSGTDVNITLTNVGSTNQVFVDGIKPAVTDIVRLTPTADTTNATSVVFRVTLSENCKGISTSAFQLAVTGAVTGTIASVSAATGNTVDVTINTVTSPGTLKLNIKNTGNGITDIAGNGLTTGFTAGQVYTINNVPSFTGGSIQSIPICRNATAISINTLLVVNDPDHTQVLIWSVIMAPAHGSLSGFNSTANANAGNVTPSSLTYTPSRNYSGADVFTIRVFDGISADTIAINTQVELITPGFTSSGLSACLNGNDFRFTNTSVITAGSLSYVWKFGDASMAFTPDASHSYMAAGSYSVGLVATSDNGCMDSAKTSLTVFPKPSPAFTINTSNQCFNKNNFVFTNRSAISSGSFSAAWLYGNGNGAATSSASYSYPATGSYTAKLVLTSNNGCKDSVSQPVEVYSHPVADFFINDSRQCFNGNNFVFTNTSPSLTTNTYQWFPGDGSRRSSIHTSYSYPRADTFKVKLLAVSGNNCPSDTVTKTAIVIANPTVNLGADLSLLQGAGQVLFPVVSGKNLTYQWAPALYLNSAVIRNPLTMPAQDITYLLTVTGEGGCTAQDDLFIKVLRIPEIPNIFSPNNDHIHDKWEIKYLDQYPNATIEVFNRSGQPVYRAKGNNIAWDGTINGIPLPAGTYYYIIDQKNGRPIITGSVTIIR
jgi:gliding motility-associated-like protein